MDKIIEYSAAPHLLARGLTCEPALHFDICFKLYFISREGFVQNIPCLRLSGDVLEVRDISRIILLSTIGLRNFFFESSPLRARFHFNRLAPQSILLNKLRLNKRE